MDLAASRLATIPPRARLLDEGSLVVENPVSSLGILTDYDFIEMEAEGVLAVCFQHEMDHLEGRLFVDYLSEVKRQRIRTRLERDHRRQSVPVA